MRRWLIIRATLQVFQKLSVHACASCSTGNTATVHMHACCQVSWIQCLQRPHFAERSCKRHKAILLRDPRRVVSQTHRAALRGWQLIDARRDAARESPAIRGSTGRARSSHYLCLKLIYKVGSLHCRLAESLSHRVHLEVALMPTLATAVYYRCIICEEELQLSCKDSMLPISVAHHQAHTGEL
jgi:hypothetical protein